MIERAKNAAALVVVIVLMTPIVIYNRTHFYGHETFLARVGPSWWQSAVDGSELFAFGLTALVLVALALERVRG